MPAHATAKIVIASANRLMLVRHFCRNRNRMAEISVPACPIPIQKTKFTMGQAQKTGALFPQTPTPVTIRYPINTKNIRVNEEETAKATYQARGGRGRSTIWQTVSVIDPAAADEGADHVANVARVVILVHHDAELL